MINNFTPFPILMSKRLMLRQLEAKDAKALFDYQSDKNNFEFVDMPVYIALEQAQSYIHKMNLGMTENKWIPWAICLKDEDEIIGTVSLWHLDDKENKAELGYGLFPAYRRKGYMKEALEKVLAYGFDDMKLLTIEAYTSVSNEPSKQFLDSQAFEFVKNFEDPYSGGALMAYYRKSK